jgi:hypothetical protein
MRMSQYTMSANQLGAVEQPPLADLERRVLEWLRTEAGFAQVYSINKDGYPVGRTMAAPIDDDFTVWLVQRKVHKRINQWRRNTRTEVVWVGTPAPGSRNDSPHVYDLNLLVPRVVFLRGDVEFLDDATLVETFQRQTAIHLARGWTRAPERTPENVVAELIGVRIRPVQVRAEGFGQGAASFTWKPAAKS